MGCSVVDTRSSGSQEVSEGLGDGKMEGPG